MIKKCPNNKLHWNNECRCVEKNPFFYYDGKWHIKEMSEKNDSSMLSLSGQLKTSDFFKDIAKNLIVYVVVLSLIFGGIVYVCVKSGTGLKTAKTKQIEQN